MDFIKREQYYTYNKSVTRISHDNSFLGTEHNVSNNILDNKVDLYGYWIPLNECDIQSNDNINCFYKDDKVLFIVHPSSYDYYEIKYEYFLITGYPTSSERTILIYLDDVPYFVKLSLNKYRDGVYRMVNKNEMDVSVNASKILMNMDLPIQILNEPMSIYLKEKEYGMIIRKVPDNINHCYSLFCFMGENGMKLISKLSNNSEIDFVLYTILKPLSKVYIETLFNHGISLQIHPQNMMIDLYNKRFVYRDLGGCNIRNQESKYSNNYLDDVKNIIEMNIIGNLCLGLTRTFVEFYDKNDEFSNWKKSIGKKIKSFTDDKIFCEIEFERYGFFELQFLKFLIEDLKPYINVININSNGLIDENYLKTINDIINNKQLFYSFGNFIVTLYQYYKI